MVHAGDFVTSAALNGDFRSMIERFVVLDSIDYDESTTSTSFTDISTRGPQVSLASRGTRALVFITCRSWNTSAAANIGCMGVQITDVNGDVVFAPATSSALMQQGFTVRSGAKRLWIGLVFTLPEPGTYTYIAKYRVGAGTGLFGNRVLAVFAP